MWTKGGVHFIILRVGGIRLVKICILVVAVRPADAALGQFTPAVSFKTPNTV